MKARFMDEQIIIIIKKHEADGKTVDVKHAFIETQQAESSVRSMCRVLAVHFSAFYAWAKVLLNYRALADVRQTGLINQAWTESGKVSGYRKLTDDPRPSRQIAWQLPAGQWMQSRTTTDQSL